MTTPTNWGADLPVSMPQPLDELNPALVDMDGFCFTAGGIAHNLSQVDWEKISTPSFAPIRPASEVVRCDADLDGQIGDG